MIEIEIVDGTYMGEIEENALMRTMRTYRREFSDTFIEFMNKYNGAEPVKTKLPLHNDTEYIDTFLSILDNVRDKGSRAIYDMKVYINNSAEFYSDFPDEVFLPDGIIDDDLIEKLEKEGDERVLKSRLVPFILLETYSDICLDYKNNPEDPEVVIRDNDKSKEFKPVVKKIADNFDEFLKFLENLELANH